MEDIKVKTPKGDVILKKGSKIKYLHAGLDFIIRDCDSKNYLLLYITPGGIKVNCIETKRIVNNDFKAGRVELVE